MMSVSLPQCSMPSSSLFLKEESVSCMRIRGMTGSRFASRSASGVTPHESHGRSADAAVLRRIDAGSWKRRTPGSTGFESFSSDMRSCLTATRRSFISLLRSSVGGRWQLFTDKSLVREVFLQKVIAQSDTLTFVDKLALSLWSFRQYFRLESKLARDKIRGNLSGWIRRVAKRLTAS